MYQKYNNGEISAQQSFILLINMIVGTGILGLSRTVAEVSRQDAWMSVLLNGAFLSGVMVIMVYTISKFPQYNFVQYTSYLLSKPVGYLISFAYVLYALFATGITIAYLCEMTATWLLSETPNYIIRFIIVITVVYMTRNGLTVVARFAQATVFILIPLGLLMLIGLPETQFINLKPIGGAGIINILKGTRPSFYAFAGYESLLVYYPYISNKEESVMKKSVWALILVTLFYTTNVITQIALYGSDEIQTVLYPAINYLTSVNFPVIERSEIFFTIFWTFTVLCTSGVQYLVSSVLLQNIFKIKRTRIFTYALAPVIFLISIYPRNTVAVVEFAGKIGTANIFFGFLLPVLLFTMYLIKGRDTSVEKSH
ncbi:GerAB/ArcD/ProY family transporter [Alkaliphilus oremlandii]|uniref:Spore germination protein n=1 Tax=Alkaliphilus oremlandii (strain OhILAs) TaxID=350688 RepID=A8ML62_ALKOO|nr:endospore germination permease [Alkaliphilus oremlandii]ABW17879.1 spore germination protein [Alkaliphilus oremlandii OhILAs]